MIAMALINNPDLLIADEPTTALDVTTQAQILTLIEKLQEEFGSAVIMITHDLGVVAEIADDVVVMYAAEVAEKGTVDADLQAAAPPVHVGADGLAAAARRRRRAARPDRGPAAVAPPPAVRLPLPPALPVRDERLQDGRSRRSRRSRTIPTHLQACHLDEETKNREAAKLLASMMAESA